MKSKIIAITIGDINGIGIKILINCWKEKQLDNFILITDLKRIKNYLNKEKLKDKINLVNINYKVINFDSNKLNIYSYNSISAEDNTYKSLKHAHRLCLKKICIGIITLPIRKDLIISKIDKKFVGHTEYFQKLDRKKYSNMILFHKKIIISPITTHIRINDISKSISFKNYIFNQVFNLDKTLKIDFNINDPKILISGLNPHAGENGKLGNEEKKIIIPEIMKLKNAGIKIDGPSSPDSMLIKKNIKNYDCFIFIYHDQALIPFKFISQFSGVNYTGNLEIIRTSPDHGTAYDLKDNKFASNKSLLNCFKLIKRIYKNRILNGKG